MAERRLAPLLVGVALLALLAYPLFRLALAAVGEGGQAALGAVSDPATLVAAWNTLVVAAAVALLAVLAGTAAAVVTERLDVPGRNALRLAMLLPLLVPLPALMWARAYGPAGMTDSLFGVSLPGLFGPLGIVVVTTTETLPLAYLVVAVSLAARHDPDLVRAARASGAGALRAFASITLPLLRPALVAAAALAFVSAANSFAVPAILGIPAGFPMLTTRIYRLFALSAEPQSFSTALTLALLLAALAFAIVLIVDVVLGLARAGTAGAPRASVPDGRRQWLPALLLWVYVALTTLVPLLGLLLMSLTRAVGLEQVPANWTLANFGAAVDAGALPAFANSLILAGSAGLVAVVLGGLLAIARGRIGRRLASAAVIGFAVPGSALAIAVLLAYGSWLRDSLLLIGLAYVAKLWALGHRPLAGALGALPRDALPAARVSGAAGLTALRTIALPLLAPAIAAAWLLVFVFALQELTISILLYGPGTATLAVVILNLQQLGDVTTTSALTVLLSAVLLAAALPLLWLRRRLVHLVWR